MTSDSPKDRRWQICPQPWFLFGILVFSFSLSKCLQFFPVEDTVWKRPQTSVAPVPGKAVKVSLRLLHPKRSPGCSSAPVDRGQVSATLWPTEWGLSSNFSTLWSSTQKTAPLAASWNLKDHETIWDKTVQRWPVLLRVCSATALPGPRGNLKASQGCLAWENPSAGREPWSYRTRLVMEFPRVKLNAGCRRTQPNTAVAHFLACVWLIYFVLYMQVFQICILSIISKSTEFSIHIAWIHTLALPQLVTMNLGK